MRLGTVALVLGLLLAFLGGGMLWKRLDGGPVAHIAEMPDERPRSTGNAAAPIPLGRAPTPVRAVPAGAAPAAPLPPVNARLAAIYDDLKRRADGGEAPAACRLSFELDRCARMPGQRKQAAATRLSAEEKSIPFFRDKELEIAQRLEARVKAAEESCREFPLENTRDGWRYLLMAAQAGHTPSMVRYVRGWTLFTTEPVPIERLDGWIAYRDHAQEWLRAAIQAGDPAAYELAALAHSRGDYFGMQLVPRDYLRAAAFYGALANAAAPQYRQMAMAKAKQARAHLSAEELVQSELLAAQLGAALRVPANGVDYTGGMADREDGSHCAGP